jgi:hypothetical protein
LETVGRSLEMKRFGAGRALPRNTKTLDPPVMSLTGTRSCALDTRLHESVAQITAAAANLRAGTLFLSILIFMLFADRAALPGTSGRNGRSKMTSFVARICGPLRM